MLSARQPDLFQAFGFQPLVHCGQKLKAKATSWCLLASAAALIFCLCCWPGLVSDEVDALWGLMKAVKGGAKLFLPWAYYASRALEAAAKYLRSKREQWVRWTWHEHVSLACTCLTRQPGCTQ